MALLCISGEIGCPAEELGRLIARRFGCEFVNEAALQKRIEADNPERPESPDGAWPYLAAAVLVQLAARGNVVFVLPGGQFLLRTMAGLFRVHVTAPEAARVGAVMLERKLDRVEARASLREEEAAAARLRRRRFGRSATRPSDVDAVLNSGSLDLERQMAMIEASVSAGNVMNSGPLPAAAEAQALFQIRLKLARFGLTAPGSVPAVRTKFGHPSEETFSKLLDFYRIQWEHEPRSFPLQWDKDGRVTEAFTPDFYLPEFDLYLELTTMKQALVTKKNHKIKLLRAIYPHVNIQVFYQKDMQDLILKYGLSRPEEAAGEGR